MTRRDEVEYAPGRWADVYGQAGGPVALLWHGTQTDSRAAVRLLAESLAEKGICVVAPERDSHADDGGRADLLNTVEFARSRGGGGALIVIGWSLGGAAAAGLTLRAAGSTDSAAQAICLAGAFMADDPISGRPVLESIANDGRRTPFTLIYGIADDVVPPSVAVQFATDLRARGWPVNVVELDADHGSIAGARYDVGLDRYEAADDPATQAVVDLVAEHIAAIAFA